MIFSNLKVFCLGVGLQTCSVTVGRIRCHQQFKAIKPSDTSILPQRNGHFCCGTATCIPSKNCYGRKKKCARSTVLKIQSFLYQRQRIPHLTKKKEEFCQQQLAVWCWLWRTRKCHLRLSGIFLWHIAQ